MDNMSWYYEKFNGYEKEMAEIRLDADGMWWYSEGYDDGSRTRRGRGSVTAASYFLFYRKINRCYYGGA